MIHPAIRKNYPAWRRKFRAWYREATLARARREIAEAAGMSPQSLAHIASGRRLPTLEQARGISKASGGKVPARLLTEAGR